MHDIKPRPVIKNALGHRWEELASIVKFHYDITPGKASSQLIKSVMDEVFHSRIAKLFLLPGRLFGALVPYKGQHIPTEVRNWTSTDHNAAMFWHRTLLFPNKPPVVFKSRMEHAKGDEIIEYVRYGMGIRMQLSVKDGALVFRSVCYVWKLGRIKPTIPTWAILGNAEIVEKALSDKEFFIHFNMIHPVFGRTFAYSGTFSIVANGS